MKKIILASQSPQRKIILETLGIEFVVLPADINEQAVGFTNLRSRAENIARAKAEAIEKIEPEKNSFEKQDVIIIAADTYPVFANQALEKPANKIEAIEMLSALSGQEFNSYTGWCYLDKKGGLDESGVAVTKVVFRKLSEGEINHYVQTQPVTTWSAAFCPAFHEGMALVTSISGSLTGFTHGLPLEKISKLLQKSGSI